MVIRRLLRGLFRTNPRDLASERSELQRLIAVHRELTAQRRRSECGGYIDGIVFSMDRALQLHALLGSYKDLTVRSSKLKIIYRASNEAYDVAYQEVFAEYSDLIDVIPQHTRQDFQPLLIQTLSLLTSEYVYFLVDDNMFIEPVDLQACASQSSIYCVPSLRLGENLSRCYVMQREQALPQTASLVGGRGDIFNTWVWKYGSLDWNYPLSVDGHFFLREEILALTKTLEFDSPNRYEEQLQRFHSVFSWRLGVCYPKSRLINIPYNKVQTDIENLHGSVHQEDMLRMWNEGYRIDRKSYYGIANESAHQELPLKLIRAGT